MSESIGEKPVLIDGSRHSGSGSLLRTALILSSLTKIPFDMINIKKNRFPPGLSEADLQTISIFQKATKADVKGAGKGSELLSFYPSEIFRQKKIVMDLNGSSISLQIQSLMIAALFSHEQNDFILDNPKAKYKKTLFEVKGTTHSSSAPNMTFLRETLIRILHKYAFSLNLTIDKISFSAEEEEFPLEQISEKNKFVVDEFKEGDLESYEKPVNVSLRVEGKHKIDQALPLLLEPNDLVFVKGEFLASKEFAKDEVLEKLAQLATMSLVFENKKERDLRAKIQTRYVNSSDKVISMNLFAYYGEDGGFDNDRAFVVAKDARIDQDFEQVNTILNNLISSFKKQVSQKQLDSTTSAFLIPVIGLIGGTFETNSLNPELLGNIYVTEKLLDISFNLEANIISTSGYIKSKDNDAVSLDDL